MGQDEVVCLNILNAYRRDSVIDEFAMEKSASKWPTPDSSLSSDWLALQSDAAIRTSSLSIDLRYFSSNQVASAIINLAS